jgi:hypothetical protein
MLNTYKNTGKNKGVILNRFKQKLNSLAKSGIIKRSRANIFKERTDLTPTVLRSLYAVRVGKINVTDCSNDDENTVFLLYLLGCLHSTETVLTVKSVTTHSKHNIKMKTLYLKPKTLYKYMAPHFAICDKSPPPPAIVSIMLTITEENFHKPMHNT